MTDARNAQQTTRVLIRPKPYARDAQNTVRVLISPKNHARSAHSTLRVLLKEESTLKFVRTWTGMDWADSPVRVWTGGAWDDVAALWVWNGTEWVEVTNVSVPDATVLMEPFNSFAAWTLGNTPTIVAGRTGTAAQTSGSLNRCTYLIAAPAQSDTLTIGFAFRKTDANATSRTVLELCDAADSVTYSTLKLEANGALGIYRGGSSQIAASAAAIIVNNTWYYLELRVKLHNTAGTVTVRRDGIDVITFTGDTSQVADDTPYGGVRLANRVASTTHQYDDLYLSMGPTATFKGDITI